MYRSLLFIVAVLAVVLVVGCVPPAVGSPANTTPAAAPGTPTSPVPNPDAGPAGGVAPDVAKRAAEWLAGEVNVSAQDLRLGKAERVEWTDSCFGLGGPAESCLQAMTPGWRIVFEAKGQQYEVRTDETGSSFRLARQAS